MVLTVVKCKKCVKLDCVGTEFLCTAKKKKMQGLDVNNSRACNYYQEREETPVTELEIAVEKEAPYGANKAIMERIKKKREAEMPVIEKPDVEETEPPKASKRGGYGGKGISLESIISLHNEGLSTLEISKRVGCSETNIVSRLKKAGLMPKREVDENGKVKKSKVYTIPTVRPPTMPSGPMPVNDVPKPSPVEVVFTNLKVNKVEQLKQFLLDLKASELVDIGNLVGLKEICDIFEKLVNGKKVA